MASYPTTPVVFPSRNDGTVIMAAHLNGLQDEVAAIEQSLVGSSYLPTPQTIRGALARVVLDPRYQTPPAPGTTTKGYLGSPVVNQSSIGQNVVYNGTDAMRDDVTKAAGQFILSGGYTLLGTIPAGGSNPSTGLQTLPFTVPPGGGLREHARNYEIGAQVDVAYSAANFTAATGTWTVPQANCTYSYTIIGKTCFVRLLVTASSTSAVTAWVRVQLPMPVSMPTSTQGAIYVNPWGASFVDLAPNVATIYANAGPTGSIPIIAGALQVSFQAAYGI